MKILILRCADRCIKEKIRKKKKRKAKKAVDAINNVTSRSIYYT